MPLQRDPLALDRNDKQRIKNRYSLGSDEQRIKNRYSLDSNNRRFGSNVSRVIATPIARQPTKQPVPVKRPPTRPLVLKDNTSALLSETMKRIRSSSPYMQREISSGSDTEKSSPTSKKASSRGNSGDSKEDGNSDSNKKDVFNFTESENKEYDSNVLSWFPSSSLLSESEKSSDEGKERIKLTSFLDECKDLASECEALFGSPKKPTRTISPKTVVEPKKERTVSISSSMTSDNKKNAAVVSRSIVQDPKKRLVNVPPSSSITMTPINKPQMVRPARVIDIDELSSEKTKPNGKPSTPLSSQSSRRVIIPLKVNKQSKPEEETKRSTNNITVVDIDSPVKGQKVLSQLLTTGMIGASKPPPKPSSEIRGSANMPLKVSSLVKDSDRNSSK